MESIERGQANPINPEIGNLNQETYDRQEGVVNLAEARQERTKNIDVVLKKINEKFYNVKDGKMSVSEEKMSKFQKLKEKLELEKKVINFEENLTKLNNKHKEYIETTKPRIDKMFNSAMGGAISEEKMSKLQKLKEIAEKSDTALILKIKLLEKVISRHKK